MMFLLAGVVNLCTWAKNVTNYWNVSGWTIASTRLVRNGSGTTTNSDDASSSSVFIEPHTTHTHWAGGCIGVLGQIRWRHRISCPNLQIQLVRNHNEKGPTVQDLRSEYQILHISKFFLCPTNDWGTGTGSVGGALLRRLRRGHPVLPLRHQLSLRQPGLQGKAHTHTPCQSRS